MANGLGDDRIGGSDLPGATDFPIGDPLDPLAGFPLGTGDPLGGTGEPGSSGSGSGGNPFTNFFKDPQNIFSLVNASIAALSGIRDAKARNDAISFTKQQLANARRLASTDNFTDIVSRLQPVFRELVAQGLGPSFQQNLSSNLAKRGLTDTGAGTALQNVGESVPSTFALREALSEGGRIQEGQVGAELGFPSIGARTDPFSEALVRGATAFFVTNQRDRDQSQGGTEGLQEQRELFPNLSGSNNRR